MLGGGEDDVTASGVAARDATRLRPAVVDPDVDVVPAQRCGCARQRRTVHRCAGCGAPVCFHCQTPPIGGKCMVCYPRRRDHLTPPARAGRLFHGAVAVAAALAAAGMAAATLLKLTTR